MLDNLILYFWFIFLYNFIAEKIFSAYIHVKQVFLSSSIIKAIANVERCNMGRSLILYRIQCVYCIVIIISALERGGLEQGLLIFTYISNFNSITIFFLLVYICLSISFLSALHMNFFIALNIFISSKITVQISKMIAPTFNFYLTDATTSTFLFQKRSDICFYFTYKYDIYIIKIYFT